MCSLPARRRLEQHCQLAAELLDLGVRIFETEPEVRGLSLSLRRTGLNVDQTLEDGSLTLRTSCALDECGEVLDRQ